MILILVPAILAAGCVAIAVYELQTRSRRAANRREWASEHGYSYATHAGSSDVFGPGSPLPSDIAAAFAGHYPLSLSRARGRQLCQGVFEGAEFAIFECSQLIYRHRYQLFTVMVMKLSRAVPPMTLRRGSALSWPMLLGSWSEFEIAGSPPISVMASDPAKAREIIHAILDELVRSQMTLLDFSGEWMMAVRIGAVPTEELDEVLRGCSQIVRAIP